MSKIEYGTKTAHAIEAINSFAKGKGTYDKLGDLCRGVAKEFQKAARAAKASAKVIDKQDPGYAKAYIVGMAKQALEVGDERINTAAAKKIVKLVEDNRNVPMFKRAEVKAKAATKSVKRTAVKAKTTAKAPAKSAPQGEAVAA